MPRRGEAVRSLAKAWDVTEVQAAALLSDPGAYAAEHRARNPLTGAEARRQLERRYPSRDLLP
jgi:hypothetical protein